ncbi:ABC transporter substrate-binding protein [Pseudomonas sp. L13]|uniref:ABC transporter substrate-binding protein n=1 Tax=Pseudomonas sp. L13 TaxID=343985 RepID=UPI00137A1185|nr:ABC transporter substrate-binding protein [Pseudomonas sp. L13]NCE89191.1 ABC transporter substrate-binding protein [Pseudomonas sp. L13]
MNNHHQRDCIEVLVEKAQRGEINRRSFIKAMGVLAAVPLAIRGNISWGTGNPLILVNWGGDAINAYKKAFTDSFTKETGIDIRIDGSGPTEGAIRTQASSGNPSWDLVDAEPYTSETLGREGILMPIDYMVVDKNLVGSGLANKYGVAGYQYSYVIAWDSEKFGTRGPATWADFFNIEKFPGKRTLYKWMNGVLEAALIADGIKADKLYPLDVARALRKLDELHPHVLAYWSSGAESQQLMVEGEVSVGAIWNTRALLINEDSEDRIKWSYDNAFITPSSWSVLKHDDIDRTPAMQFINSALAPQKQVELLKLMGNGTTNPQCAELLSAEWLAKDCGSPENLAKQVRLDIEWYVDNYGTTLDQYLGRIGN